MLRAMIDDERTVVLLRPLRVLNVGPFLRYNREFSCQKIWSRSGWIWETIDIVSTTPVFDSVYDQKNAGNGGDTDTEEGEHFR